MTRSTGRRVFRGLVATLKGGPGKTTTAVLLAFALARRGKKVVLIEADTTTQGTTDWRNKILKRGFTLPDNLIIVIWRGEEKDGPLGRFARRAEAEQSPDAVIIDTGGEHPDVFMSAGLYADRLIAPVGAQEGELSRMWATVQKAAEIDEASELVMSVVLTRVEAPGKGLARDARHFLDGTLAEWEAAQGIPEAERTGQEVYVHATEIPRNYTTYGEVWGTVPEDLGKYNDLAEEVLSEMESEGEAA